MKAKCLNCGKEFEFFPSRSSGKYCSQKCYHEFQKPHNKLDVPNKEELEQLKKTKKIKELMEIYQVSKATIYRWFHIHNIKLRPDFKGENNPCWRGGKKEIICKNCHKKFKADKSSNRKFCSFKCFVEYVKKNSLLKGKNNPMYGKTPWCKGLTKETNTRLKEIAEKMSKIRKKLYGEGKLKPLKGAENPAWKGGISKESYPFDFDEELKELIRKRDNYTCQLCGKQQYSEKRKEYRLAVHHIDYNKKNLNPDNLITLCNKCHAKTNHNRKKWQNYFTKRMKLLKAKEEVEG